MKVSVQIITYNHREFIAQAINSVLQQQVDFDYEVVIGDDCSTDGTQEILKEFARTHSDRIRLLLHDPKLAGLPGKQNFITSLQACQGEYVAMLDGDDYWTDPLKLSKQVKFLDENPDFAIACHNVRICYDDGRSPQLFRSPEQQEILTIEDLFISHPIHSCAAVFRNNLFESFPDWFAEISTGDWILHILNARAGKIRYFPEVMATYRVHTNAFWSGRPKTEQIIEAIRIMNLLKGFLDPEYEAKLRWSEGLWYRELAWAYYEVGERRQARHASAKYLSICEGSGRTKKLALFLRDELPFLHRWLKSFTRFSLPRLTRHDIKS